MVLCGRGPRGPSYEDQYAWKAGGLSVHSTVVWVVRGLLACPCCQSMVTFYIARLHNGHSQMYTHTLLLKYLHTCQSVLLQNFDPNNFNFIVFPF